MRWKICGVKSWVLTRKKNELVERRGTTPLYVASPEGEFGIVTLQTTDARAEKDLCSYTKHIKQPTTENVTSRVLVAAVAVPVKHAR